MAERYTFNPGFMSDTQSISNFLVRLSELQTILAGLEGRGGTSGERFLLLGPRGAGKTTMCRRVLAEVRTNLFLRKRWEPIFLSEESYTVTTPGELLLECLFQLAQQPQWEEAGLRYGEARLISDEADLRAHCLAFFREKAEALEKRFLIIVENLHMIMRDQLTGDPDELIGVISQSDVFGVLATAVEQTIDESADPHPHEFSLIELRPLSLIECQTLWKGLTGLDADRAKIRPLQILTGGSPRLIHILAEFMQTPSLSDLMSNLNQLIDQNTEYFKNQLDLLPSGERKVFVTLLEAWDPNSAKQVAEAARVAINLASAALNRLSERGMVEKTPGPGRSILYHASERLFNIYYLMRRRTHPSDRVRALVTFMTQYYDQKELVETTTRLAFEACRMEPSQRGDHHSVFEAISRGLPDAARTQMLQQTPPDFLESLQRDEFVLRFSPDKNATICGPTKQSSYGASLEAARQALNDGNFEDAGEHAAKASSLRPKAIQPWIIRALIGLFSEDFENGIAAAKKAVELKPEDMAAHSMLGTVLAASGRDAEAESSLERTIELNPEAVRALIELAKIRQKQGKSDEAIELYWRASQVSPLPDADLAQYGRLLASLNRQQEAEEELKSSIPQIDDAKRSRRVLAELLHDQDRNTEASVLLRETALASDDWDDWADLASFIVGVQSDGAAAQEVIRDAFAKGITAPNLYWLLARAKQLEGEARSEIAEVARQCLSNHLDKPFGWMMAGQIFELVDEVADAEETYRNAISSDMDHNGGVSLLLGQLLANHSHQYEEAEAVMRSAIGKGQGEYCGPLMELAELVVHRGDDNHADQLAADALSINERCHCSLLLKGQIAIRSRNLAEAKELFERALEIEPLNIDAYAALAGISTPEVAAELIAKAQELAPDHPVVLLARGQLDQRPVSERLEDVRDALRTDPGLAEAKLELAALNVHIGREDETALLLTDVLTTLQSRMELIPAFVDSAIEIANSGKANIVEEVLESPAGAILEPLSVALKIYRGETPIVAKEVLDVAEDIAKRLLTPLV